MLAEIVGADVYALRSLDEHSSLIIDVGAGVGEFSGLAAARHPQARVIAIEPDPDRYELLRRNVTRNGLTNVELHAAAAGPASNGDEPLAALIAGRHVDLLKIDCEGAEVDVLRTLANDDLGRIGRIVLEWHNVPGARRDEQAAALLRGHGFVVRLAPDRYEPARGYLYADRVAPPAPV